MKRLMMAALLVALASAPSVAQAATINATPGTAMVGAGSPARPRVSPIPVGPAPGDTADYAAREAAAPGLGAFQGGSVVIFLSGGAVLVVVIIVLIVVLA